MLAQSTESSRKKRPQDGRAMKTSPGQQRVEQRFPYKEV